MVIKQTKIDKAFDVINVLILTMVLVVVLYPLLFVVSASLSDPMLVLQGKVWLFPKDINLDAYRKVFQNDNIMIGYRNTILYTIVGITVSLSMTIAGAYPLSRKDFFGRNLLIAIFTFTMFFSGGLIPTYLMIKKLGLVDNFWVMVLPNAIAMYNLIVMRTFFQNTIPIELQEAAFIDGCSNIRILLRIVLPLSLPIIAVMVIFYGVARWNMFFNALIYLSDRKKYPLQLVLREILIQNEMKNMMETDVESLARQQMLAEGLKYAVIIVASVPVLLLYPFLQKYFMKGVMVGAVKG